MNSDERKEYFPHFDCRAFLHWKPRKTGVCHVGKTNARGQRNVSQYINATIFKTSHGLCVRIALVYAGRQAAHEIFRLVVRSNAGLQQT